MNLFDVIISEMARGKFSFLILVAGIAQLIVNDTEKISGFRAALFFVLQKTHKNKKEKTEIVDTKRDTNLCLSVYYLCMSMYFRVNKKPRKPLKTLDFPEFAGFFMSGEDGIRTHAPLRTNGFQDRLVMTTSIPLQ